MHISFDELSLDECCGARVGLWDYVVQKDDFGNKNGLNWVSIIPHLIKCIELPTISRQIRALPLCTTTYPPYFDAFLPSSSGRVARVFEG